MSVSILPNPRCSNCIKESCASKGKCGQWEKKGGIFFLHRALGVQWHQCAQVTQLQRGIYGRDVRKRPAAHAGPVKTFAQDHMKTHVQSPDMIQQRNDILHNLPWRQWTKESLNLSARVDRGWSHVSKPPLLFHHKLFPVGLTQSRMDLFSAPNLFSLSLDPWLLSSVSFSSPSSSASDFLLRGLFQTVVLFCSVLSLFPLWLFL